jgi:O-acetyl-ADP-ribose deacetylase (regulator of RNase III)
MAKLVGVDSVSIPAISSGVLGFPKDECAEIIIRRVS